MPLTSANFNVTNATPSDIAALNTSLSYLGGASAAATALQNAANAGVTINIVGNGDQDGYNPNTNTINWNPNDALAVVDTSDNNGFIGEDSPALNLFHEIVHASDYAGNPSQYIQDVQSQVADYDNQEEYNAVTATNVVAQQLLEPLRYNHADGGDPSIADDGFTYELDPTEHTNTNNDGTASWIGNSNTKTDGVYEYGTVPLIAPTSGGDTGQSGALNIYGPNQTYSPSSGDNIGVYASNTTIDASSTTAQLLAASSATNINGNYNNESGVSNTFLNSTGFDNNISVAQGSVLGDYGGAGTVSAVNGSLVEVGSTNGAFTTVTGTNLTSSGTTFNGQGTGVVVLPDAQGNLLLSGSSVTEYGAASVGLYGGGNTASTTAGALFEVGSTGTNRDTIVVSNDGTGGTTANGQGTGLVFLANAYGTIDGSDNHATLDASGVNLDANYTNIGIPQDLTGITINGGENVADIGSNVNAIFYGNNITIHGGDSDRLTIEGEDDKVDLTDSVVDFEGANSGDDVNGTGDSGSDWGGSSSNDGGEYGGYNGYGGYGGYAFSKAPSTSGTNIGVIASFDADLTDQADAQTAETARLEAEAALSSTSSSYTPVFEGAKWAAGATITWSVAANPNNNGAQLSGTIDSQYVSLIESAFQTWAAVSGLKFQQVTGSTTADIQLGWSTFNSAATGVLGYTGFKSMNGSILAGALISLENPADDALTTDANGQLAYTGTQTELEQLILHEIGHALGLADNSDPNSIMNAVLSASNRTLDSTDVAGIEALYEPTTIAATTASVAASVTTGLSDIASLAASSPITVASSLISSLTSSGLSPFTTEADQLIDAMAAFSPTASPTTFIPTTLAAVASGMTLATAGT